MRPVFLSFLASLLLVSCAAQHPVMVGPTSTHSVRVAAIQTPPPQPGIDVTPTRTLNTSSPTTTPTVSSKTFTSTLATGDVEYIDDSLCIAISAPSTWKVSTSHSASIGFYPGGEQDFSIVNGGVPAVALQDALIGLKRGSLGSSIQEVKDFQVGNRPALWVSFEPGAEMGYQFLVMVISSDCGDGNHNLDISARGAERIDRETFEIFLRRIRFLRE